MGRRHRELKEQLLREMQHARRSFLQALGSTNRELLTRLAEVYARRVENLTSQIERAMADLPEAPSVDELRGSERLEALRREMSRELNLMRTAIEQAGRTAQRDGVAAGYGSALRVLERGGLSARMGIPEVNTIQQGVNLVGHPAFQESLEQYGSYHAQQISDALIDGMSRGLNPNETARMIVRSLDKKNAMPLVDAVRMTRTTQLYAARLGQRELFKSMGDVVKGWLWSANLGNPRTCISCIVQHGTFYPVTEVLNDHHLGRCAPMPVTPKWEDLGFIGEREFYETRDESLGIEWLVSQPDDVQRQHMGQARWLAWKEDKFKLIDIVDKGVYEHPVFGKMRRPAPLSSLVTDRQEQRRLYNMARRGTWSDGELIHEHLVTAREITPRMIEQGRVTGTWFDLMVDMFAYDNRGEPIYGAPRVEYQKTDFLYRVWGLGGGDHAYREMPEIRREAAAIRAAYEQSLIAFTEMEVDALVRLSSADDQVVFDAIDEIRDRRYKWRRRVKTGSAPLKEVSRVRKARMEEVRERLRESQFGVGHNPDDVSWSNFDLGG